MFVPLMMSAVAVVVGASLSLAENLENKNNEIDETSTSDGRFIDLGADTRVEINGKRFSFFLVSSFDSVDFAKCKENSKEV